MDRDQMLQREADAWASLADAFGSVPEERRTVEGVVPGWSTHDLVWHCVYWADYVAATLEMRSAGDGGEPDALEESEVVAQGRALAWDEILTRAAAARERLRAAIGALGEIDTETEDLVAGESYDHYDEHAAEIRAFNA